MKYTRSKAEIEPKSGGKYSILDGRCLGEYIELVCVKRLASDIECSLNGKHKAWSS